MYIATLLVCTVDIFIIVYLCVYTTMNVIIIINYSVCL